MKSKPEKPVIKLDWSRLLGFNQSEPIAGAKEAGQLNDPRLAKIVVVKSGYLSPELAPIANPSLMALTPGAVDQFVERLPRLRKAHPTYPFDDNFDFSPETLLSARSVGR